jgi:hypothetical protein
MREITPPTEPPSGWPPVGWGAKLDGRTGGACGGRWACYNAGDITENVARMGAGPSSPQGHTRSGIACDKTVTQTTPKPVAVAE